MALATVEVASIEVERWACGCRIVDGGAEGVDSRRTGDGDGLDAEAGAQVTSSDGICSTANFGTVLAWLTSEVAGMGLNSYLETSQLTNVP